eukprot:2932131-Rhodomonas_salina.3
MFSGEGEEEQGRGGRKRKRLGGEGSWKRSGERGSTHVNARVLVVVWVHSWVQYSRLHPLLCLLVVCVCARARVCIYHACVRVSAQALADVCQKL